MWPTDAAGSGQRRAVYYGINPEFFLSDFPGCLTPGALHGGGGGGGGNVAC